MPSARNSIPSGFGGLAGTYFASGDTLLHVRYQTASSGSVFRYLSPPSPSMLTLRLSASAGVLPLGLTRKLTSGLNWLMMRRARSVLIVTLYFFCSSVTTSVNLTIFALGANGSSFASFGHSALSFSISLSAACDWYAMPLYVWRLSKTWE